MAVGKVVVQRSQWPLSCQGNFVELEGRRPPAPVNSIAFRVHGPSDNNKNCEMTICGFRNGELPSRPYTARVPHMILSITGALRSRSQPSVARYGGQNIC